jgi:hypothetical protein
VQLGAYESDLKRYKSEIVAREAEIAGIDKRFDRNSPEKKKEVADIKLEIRQKTTYIDLALVKVHRLSDMMSLANKLKSLEEHYSLAPAHQLLSDVLNRMQEAQYQGSAIDKFNDCISKLAAAEDEVRHNLSRKVA